MSITIPGGQEKGVALSDATTKSITWWLNKMKAQLADGTARFPDRDQDWVDAAEEELARRADGGALEPTAQDAPRSEPRQQAAPRQQRSITTRHADTLVQGAASDPQAVTAKLRELSEQYHLVSPATSCPALPEGCGVAISLVHVDPDPDPYKGPKEVYDVGGRLGLSGTTLDRVAAAAGLSWDPVRSGRLDDGRDPHYCHFRAVGTVRNFDGSERTVSGEVEIDARDGSPQIEEIIEKAKRGRNGPRDPANQIRELRKFLLRHAESKARNRAIACMGVKRSYAPNELQKPFAVARIMWTGETSDPELRREAFLARQAAMSGSAAMLYGQAQPRALPASTGHAPPPVGAVRDTDGYEPEGDEY